MNILLSTLGDPTWQLLALVIKLAAPVLIVVVRTHDMHATAQQKRRETLTMHWVWRATFLLMSGVVVALHLPDAAPQRTRALHRHPYQRWRLHLHRSPHQHPSRPSHRLLGSPIPIRRS